VMASSGRSWPVLVRGRGLFAAVDGGVMVCGDGGEVGPSKQEEEEG
jgi:hypothetical protein